jgi:hypothetical protein
MKNTESRVAARRSVLAAATAVFLAIGLPSRSTGLLNDGDLHTDIAAVPPSVTQSTAALATYATYTVTVTKKDAPDGQHGQLRFQGSTSVADLPAGSTESATLVSFSGAHCSSVGSSTIDCDIDGTLNATGQTVSFSVTFKTPSAGTSITLGGQTLATESSFGNTYFEVTDSASATTVLTVPDPNKVSTYVPTTTTKTTFYTGIHGGTATQDDTWTTTVVVPPASQATTASVAETVSAVTCAANLLTCSTSALAIPGTFANLTIILRRDATTIARHAKISSAKIFYDNPAHADPRVAYPLQVLPCNDTTYGPLPQSGIPCIASRKDYPDRSSRKQPVPAGFEGDWEFVIFAIDNGRFTN